MAPEDFDALTLKLDNLQAHFNVLDAKEDLLLKMLDQVQMKLDMPSIVEPRLPRWAVVLGVSFIAVVGISLLVIVGSLLIG